MIKRDYSGRVIPHLKKARKPAKSSGGMGIGAVLFLIILIGSFIAASYLIPLLMDDIVLPDIGIPYPALFLIILGCTILVAVILMVRPSMYVENRIGQRVRDPTTCQRVVKDGFEGPEVIISGPREATFAQVCRDNWSFQNVVKKSSWFIRDAQGNDVTHKSLESVDGIFILVSNYSTEIHKEVTDESDEYSSIHDSVEYYD